MTVSVTTREIEYVGTSIQTVFSFPFNVPTAADMIVSLTEIATNTEVILSPSTYTIANLNSEGGGSVTYPVTGSPIASTHRIKIKRRMVPLQTVSQANQDAYQPSVIEPVWDRLTLMAQDALGESAAALSAAESVSAFEGFDQRYLGAYAADPTLDNVGNALIDGALYFNTGTDTMRVYSDPSWANLTGMSAAANLSDVGSYDISRTNLGVIGKFTTINTTTSPVLADAGKIYYAISDLTINLPAVASIPDNWTIRVISVTDEVTIQPDGSEVISGALSMTLGKGDWIDIHCTGTAWVTADSRDSRVEFNITSTTGNARCTAPAWATRARVVISEVEPVITGAQLLLRVGDGGGTVMITNSYYSVWSSNNGSTVTASGSSATSFPCSLAIATGGIDNHAFGEVFVQGLNQASGRVAVRVDMHQVVTATPTTLDLRGRTYGTNLNWREIFFFMDTGNLGVFKAVVHWER